MDFSKSPVLNFFRKKPDSVTFKFIPEEIEVINAIKIVHGNWQEKQDHDQSISDEYKKYQVVSKVIKIFPKQPKERIHLIYDLHQLGKL